MTTATAETATQKHQPGKPLDRMADEDRLDRNNRNTSDSADRLTDKLYAVSTQVAVLATKMESLTFTVEKRLDNVDLAIRDTAVRFATVDQIKETNTEVEKLKTYLSWGVKIIVGAFLLALVAIVFRNGVPGK